MKSIQLITVFVSLFAWLFSSGLAYCQILDRNTHLAPPENALNGDRIDHWDELGCQFRILMPEVRIRTYSYKLTRERIAKTPDWDVNELNPKIPPGLALRIAKRKFESVKPFGDIGDINYRTELQLQQYWLKWLWAVFFIPEDVPIRGNQNGGFAVGFPVFVLMDGGVLHPEETTK